MSFMRLGFTMNGLRQMIRTRRLSSVAQVKEAAKKANLADAAGCSTLPPQKLDMWYTQLAQNLFEHDDSDIPCFKDIGFGEELLKHSFDHPPKKQPWLFKVTRSGYPDWQFRASVMSYSRQEALCVLKNFFCDTGIQGFDYTSISEPSRSMKGMKNPKNAWVEINPLTPGLYKDYIKTRKQMA